MHAAKSHISNFSTKPQTNLSKPHQSSAIRARQTPPKQSSRPNCWTAISPARNVTKGTQDRQCAAPAPAPAPMLRATLARPTPLPRNAGSETRGPTITHHHTHTHTHTRHTNPQCVLGTHVRYGTDIPNFAAARAAAGAKSVNPEPYRITCLM